MHAPTPEFEPQQPNPEGGVEVQSKQNYGAPAAAKESAFKNLGSLDRLLAIWIFLAMLVGILLGNFVPGISSALQKGEFGNVSLPIGEYPQPTTTLGFRS